MPKPNLTLSIDKVKQYIFDANAFTHFSFYPQEYLNSTSVGLLKKNNWLNNRYIEKPAINLEKLVHEGMSKKQAELCLYLIENRKLFCCATAFGDDRVWKERVVNGDVKARINGAGFDPLIAAGASKIGHNSRASMRAWL